MHNNIDLIIKESLQSLVYKDVPIGAIIVKDGKIISSGYNTREKDQNVLGHAEINAIIDAQKKLNNWNLNGCDLYVSLKPCSMCSEIIKQSRISNVYYLVDKSEEKKEFYKTNFNKKNNHLKEQEYLSILSIFFKELREKKQ